MISLFSVSKLAFTKLKTRRLRLAISLIIISLLFSILIAATIVQAGFFASFNKFSSEGLAGRYLVAGYGGPIAWGGAGVSQNPVIIERAETLQNRLRKQKTEKAEELGLKYQPEWDTAVRVQPDGSKFLSYNSPIAKQAIAEYRAGQKQSGESSFREQLANLNPTATYRALNIGYNDSNLVYLKDGQEPTAAELADWGQQGRGFGGIAQGVWKLMDDDLLSSYVLDGQSLDIGEDGSIPVIAPSYAVEQELKIEPLADDASAAEKRERIELLRKESVTMSFEVCYRNAKANDLYNKAVGQQSDKAANGNKDDYETPELLYGLPKSPCTAPVVESDARNEATKKTEEKWQEFNEFFEQPEPVSRLLKFRVVGIKKDYNPSPQGQPTGSVYTPEQIFDTAFNTLAGYGWLSPLTTQDKDQTVKDLFFQDPGSILGDMTTYYAEFSSAESAKQALLDHSCTAGYPGEEKGLLGTEIEKNADKTECSRDGRQFALEAFGSNSIAIDQFKSLTQRVLLIAATVIGALAAVVLMGMVGRIIADSRRETAIFRAVGATRLSIMQVYFTYTGFLILWIVGLSMLFGFAGAYIFNSLFSPNFSVAAAVAFSSKDLSQQFTFVGINWANLGLVVAVVISASYLAATLPILRSVRRNPISDMREE